MNILCKKNARLLLSFRTCGSGDWIHTSQPLCSLSADKDLNKVFHLNNQRTNQKTKCLLLNKSSAVNLSGLNLLRHYSQEKSNSSGFSNPLKWVLFISCSGLVGGLIYKIMEDRKFSNENIQEKDLKGAKGGHKKVFKFPVNSADIPNHVPYLLIGGGTASFSAFRAIKAADPTAKVLIITDEKYLPYMRPPLTKELVYNKDRELTKTLRFSQWNGSERSVFFEPEEFYLPCEGLNESETGGVSVARGWKVVELNPELKYVLLEDGKRIDYNKCLLSTGAVPKNLPVFSNISQKLQDKVTYYRSIYDFERLESELENGAKSIVIVGGGFTGSELSCSLARRGIHVTQVYKESCNMAQVLPPYLSSWLTAKIEKQGVNLLKNTEIKDVKLINNKVQIDTGNNESILADFIVLAVGVEPNTDLANNAGLEVDPVLGGFLVNAELEARTDLYAAGDCACFYDKKLGRRRVEHHDHAVISGRLAGENMTGAGKPFVHQSMFWSDFGPDLGYEAIGIIDSSLPTVAVYYEQSSSDTEKNGTPVVTDSLDNSVPEKSKDEFKKGVVFYLKNNEIVGIVMWNLFNRISTARQVLMSNVKLEDLKEVAKLFSLNATVTE